jgi:hypothetical protein
MKTLIAAIVAAACLFPAASFAGDKEWATAGKILTGVVGLQFLQKAHKHSSHSYSSNCGTRSHSYHRPHHSHSHGHVHKQVTVVHAANCGCSSCRPAPVVHRTTTIYKGTVPHCSNPVVLEVNSTRRIFQPRIKGHTAYLQILDQGQWITLREYPSVY